jgi:hypothetical protein
MCYDSTHLCVQTYIIVFDQIWIMLYVTSCVVWTRGSLLLGPWIVQPVS